MDPEPFLEIDQFAEEFDRALTDGERSQAERLLIVVSDYIRLRAPGASGLAAEQVVFEVVRDAITYGPYERLSSFENETDKRRERGTFDYAVKVLDEILTAKHRQMLGISSSPRPAYYFGD